MSFDSLVICHDSFLFSVEEVEEMEEEEEIEVDDPVEEEVIEEYVDEYVIHSIGRPEWASFQFQHSLIR